MNDVASEVRSHYKSVLQDWVMELTMRQQGVLLCAMRGPDGVAKEDAAKPIVRTLRALVLNVGSLLRPLVWGEKSEQGRFASLEYICDHTLWTIAVKTFYGSIDQYNIHFIQHLLHAYGVVGANYIIHPELAQRCWAFYEQGVHKLHMYPETQDQIKFRLRDGMRSEDY